MVSELLHGHGRFLKEYAREERAYLARLASEGQSPDAVFIGCADSRVVPELLTRSAPGELFVVRNVANVVPAYEKGSASVGAAVEYALGVLGIEDIIVCGHDGCGGVQAALNPRATLDPYPTLQRWIEELAPLQGCVPDDLAEQSRVTFAVEENVLLQLDHLLTYPIVKSGVEKGKIKLHGWVYDIHSSRLRVFDGADDTFYLVDDAPPESLK